MPQNTCHGSEFPIFNTLVIDGFGRPFEDVSICSYGHSDFWYFIQTKIVWIPFVILFDAEVHPNRRTLRRLRGIALSALRCVCRYLSQNSIRLLQGDCDVLGLRGD